MAASWLLLALSVLFSPLFQLGLPQWVVDASPFAHQEAPTVEVDTAAAVVLLAVATAVAPAGTLAFRRRDLRPD